MLSSLIRRECGALALALVLASCGRSGRGKNQSGPELPPNAQAFADVAQQYQIPKEILLAVAYKESGLSPQPSRGFYDRDGSVMGMLNGQTAIGLARQTLGLSDDGSGEQLRPQLEAYGALIRSKLDAMHLELGLDMRNPDHVYDWVWQLARIHYPDRQSRKNVQIVFALEMIDTLNKGFIWQDPASTEVIEMQPRNPPLSRASFSPPIQANLQLDTRRSEIFSVDYLQLSYGESTGTENKPKKIMVIHCALSLSNCLGSQLQPSNQDSVFLGAHYVIPADELFLQRPVKVLQHKTPVRLTGEDGQLKLINDALVVMLVGNSGRYVDGQRMRVDPSWYSKQQLKNLGLLVQGVCEQLYRDDPTLSPEECKRPFVGTQFQLPSGQAFRIGDIPDFDLSIFTSFIKNPDDLSGEVKIQLPANQKLFTAGNPIAVSLAFIRGTAKLELQLLERCSTGKTVWTTLQSTYIRNTDRKSLDVTLFDQGPNLNGQHFLRAMAYDAEGKLMGWDMKDLMLSGFEREGTPGPGAGACGAI